MARLRDSWRTSLSAPQQPRNPQPESIARSPYHTGKDRPMSKTKTLVIALSILTSLAGIGAAGPAMARGGHGGGHHGGGHHGGGWGHGHGWGYGFGYGGYAPTYDYGGCDPKRFSEYDGGIGFKKVCY